MLETIESEKDLGLIVNNKLDFVDQIKNCPSKANKMIAFIGILSVSLRMLWY